jgi:succinate dehydrogenase / fumarate reductase iron-sulfur subunit
LELKSVGDRLQFVAENSGLARCHTVFNCTMVCPREIEVTVAIGELKMATITGKLE